MLHRPEIKGARNYGIVLIFFLSTFTNFLKLSTASKFMRRYREAGPILSSLESEILLPLFEDKVKIFDFQTL